MATYSKKIQDPTEAALSAIQEALNVHSAEAQPAEDRGGAPADPQSEANHRPAGAATSTSSAATADQQNEGARALPDELPPARLAANDDRQSIGQILQSLQHRPPRTSYLVATLFALAWVAGGFILTGIYSPDLQASLSQSGAGTPALIGLAAIVLAPVAFFFVLAHMVWRAQELRLIAQSMASVAMRLAEPEEVTRDSIVTVGQAIRREVAAMGDGVERALARAGELETLVANEVSALERTYHDNEVRIRGVLDNLAQQRESLVSQAEQIRNSISSIHLDLTRDISATSDFVTERINESTNRIAQSLTERGEHITLALGRASDSMIDGLAQRGGDLLERLEHTSQETSHAITTASERLTSSLNVKSDRVSEEFTQLTTNLTGLMQQKLDDVAQGFAQKSSAIVQMMESRAQQITDTLIDTSSQLAETIVTRADEAHHTLKSTGDSLVLDLSLRGDEVASRIAQTGAQITETLDLRANKVTDSFRASAEQLVSVVGARSDAIQEILEARLQTFETMFSQNGVEMTEKIARDSTTLGSLITRHLVEFDQTVKTYGGELVERLGQRTQDVSEAMHAYIDNFDAKVGGKTTEVAAVLDQHLTRFQEEIDNRTQTLNNEIGARATEMTGNLDARIGRLEELLIGRAEAVTQQLETHSKAAADLLGARSEQLTHAIKTNSAEAERTLTALSAGVNNALKQNAGEVQRVLVGVSTEVARNFVGKANEINAAVSQRAAEMTRILDDKSSGLLSVLGSKSKELTSEVSRITDNTVKAIEAQGLNFARTMMDNSEQIARLINEASGQATDTVNRTLKDLQQSTQSAVEQSKQAATVSVTEILETNNMLRADTTTLFERLREANILLQEVLSGAHENMSTIENTLVTRVSEFVATMNELSDRSGIASSQVDEHIASFRTVTGKVLSDLSQLATQFDSHGRALAETVAKFDDSNHRTEDTLADRRAVLDSLVAAIDMRTEDLDQRLQRFSGMLDESLDGASERASEIARMIVESSSEGANAISQQFEIVRSISAEERQRTSETLRGLHEQTTGEASSIFTQTMQRFTETLQGMKRMAAEMQRELEATRAELRRGILELPQETAESTAQMRRVIVDQIEALAELNRIVARHGRGLDAAEPARRTTREEPILTSAISRMEMAPPRPAPRPDSASTGHTPSPRRPDSHPISSVQGNGRAGWLSDLLQRASRPEEPPAEERPPRHSIESLDSLSVDIARMIDHDAATELWDRYKRGERNVFTRRLYTLQGQKTFDEVRKKYQADHEFKQTVDRYIAEFERLLEEVARDDRGQVVARTYLTSETGKVYTMLAHAAGRFGE